MVHSPPNIKEKHRAAKRSNILRLNLNVLPRALVFHTEAIHKTPQKAGEELCIFHNLHHASVRRPLL